MAHLIFNKGDLIESLRNNVKSKTGIVLSDEDIIRLCKNDFNNSILSKSMNNGGRLEATEYENLYYELLENLGLKDKAEDYTTISSSIKMFASTPYEDMSFKILSIFGNNAPRNEEEIDMFLENCFKECGTMGLVIGLKIITYFINKIKYSLFNSLPVIEYDCLIRLSDLHTAQIGFEETEVVDFDRRFLFYLNENFDELDKIHWRNFELITAKYFKDLGYKTTLLKGTNDGGVDIKFTNSSGDIVFVQCKKWNGNVGISVIKELTATVDHNDQGATRGVVVCSHSLSKPARKFINDYSLKIDSIERQSFKECLAYMIMNSN